MFRVDLHVHTKYSPDSTTSLSNILKRAINKNLDCIAITDHGTIEGALFLKDMAPFQVIVGQEIKTTQGDIIGLFLSKGIPSGLGVIEAAECVKRQGGLVVLPHPFDKIRGSALSSEAIADVLPMTDIIEGFNARNVFRGSDRMAVELANSNNIPIVAVSDAHSLPELGSTYIQVPKLSNDPKEFLRVIKQGFLVEKRSNPLVHFITTYNSLLKQFLLR